MVNSYKKIQKRDLLDFINDLMKEYIVYGPVENKGPVDADDEFMFKKIKSAEEVSLRHAPSMIPPKKYFLPNKEALFEIQDSNIKELKEEEKFVIFGVHACDINSFLILDKIFAEGPFNDPYYERRRENSIIIGVNSEPTEYCFSKSMEKKKAETGFDLFLTEIPDENEYIVTIGSEIGEKLASENKFRSVEKGFAEKVIEKSLEWEEEITVETQDLPKITHQSFGDEDIWGELGERCLGCGNCTMVCPCCNCFDIKDEGSLESPKASRNRTWNACTLLEFAEVSGGNFRRSIKSRYRNWFYDKFNIFPKEIDEFGCVGCGRCIRSCPVDIDPREIIRELRDKYGE
ncbi:hypothetical protein AKJ45_02450 [candidate division MSBL1 archaeon SCGC-AAA261F19]|uniref:4Fe-4S ferredoxin-type domain-containing protein n=1 Tax=candidate division MSBL1 archaeon SCGC-AAA261F19 TaxID=1698275 RepID=A0A133V9L8_9EURY|nr:hypothetical protein AKJ45_02450 [candidate division MSBL1 archaeon SCGC-AAA261F19]